MTTKNIIPQADGEGSIGIEGTSWASGVFNTGVFEDLLVGGSSIVLASDFGITLNNYVNKNEISIGASNNVGIGIDEPSSKLEVHSATNDSCLHLKSTDPFVDLKMSDDTTTDAGIRVSNKGDDLLLQRGGGNVGIGTTSPAAKLDIDGDISISGAIISTDSDGRVLFSDQGLMVGQAEVKPDPTDPESLYFAKTPQVQDEEGNPVTVLTAEKLGLGTSAVLESSDLDLQFKLLTDEKRFVVGTSGNAENTIASGWYRFNDFQVKGATDIGSNPINPVDTRIYSDDSSFILFKTDVNGNRVAHLVGGNEAVSPNNAIALGIAVKVDSSETPQDVEFVHSDGESYSLINGNSDSVGTNGLPISQGFQNPSLGSNPAPLLIDGGSF